jgi:DNA-binding cell septation regulator SpoVG
MEQFIIQVMKGDDGIFIATVFSASHDSRGTSTAIMGMAASDDRKDAIYDAVTNAFFDV